jgi:hypothetical protein
MSQSFSTISDHFDALVTQYWTVRVTDYGLNDVLGELVDKNMIAVDAIAICDGQKGLI